MSGYDWCLLLEGVGDNLPNQPYVQSSKPLLFKFQRKVVCSVLPGTALLGGHRLAGPSTGRSGNGWFIGV